MINIPEKDLMRFAELMKSKIEQISHIRTSRGSILTAAAVCRRTCKAGFIMG